MKDFKHMVDSPVSHCRLFALKRRLIVFHILLFLSICNWINAQKNTYGNVHQVSYQQLCYNIQSRADIFKDSKTFVDCIPLFDTTVISQKYNNLRLKENGDVLRKFVSDNFIVPESAPVYRTDSSDINEHISLLWNVLKRNPDKKSAGSLLPLPYPYLVPGGRFREIYYWDSYFTMLGLKIDQQHEIIRQMVDNFTYLINTYGFIPNGNRSYYLGRSQPPFYSYMVTLLASMEGDSCYKRYLPAMVKEYIFWMDGVDKLSEKERAYHHVVKMGDGSILNRYWDNFDTPRPEAFREDMHTANLAQQYHPERRKSEVFRNLRATAESGWDFSSRWIEMSKDSFALYNIHTVDIVPPDLNSLLYHLETAIAAAFALENDSAQSLIFTEKSRLRKQALIHYCWSDYTGFFMDYDFRKQQQTDVLSLAGIYPLFANIASSDQAISIASIIENKFLTQGGVLSTLNHTGQQWDAPNGWAPLQWITIAGLRNYHHLDLANEIKSRWLRLNQMVYKNTYKLTEKYNVEDSSLNGGGGEYPNQDGFGWTNGVYQMLSKE